MSLSENLPPVIETERLRLRPHEAEDFDACVAMWSDPAIARHTIGDPSPPPQTWRRILAYRGHWTMLGFGYWAVEEKATGQYIGDIGFADFKRDIVSAMRGSPELGFALTPRFHGQGYATECANAVLAWGDEHLHQPRTVCLVNPENVASRRVVEKCGYEVFGQGTYSERAVLFLARGSALV